MSIQAREHVIFISPTSDSPKCPSAPILKPFSSSTTLDEEEDRNRDSNNSNSEESVQDDFFEKKIIKPRLLKKPMIQFLKEKILKRQKKRIF